MVACSNFTRVRISKLLVSLYHYIPGPPSIAPHYVARRRCVSTTLTSYPSYRRRVLAQRCLSTESFTPIRPTTLDPAPAPPLVAGSSPTSPGADPPTSQVAPHGSAQESRAPVRPASRIRARKAAMTLTPAAVTHLRYLLDQPEPKLIRVGVKNKGCSGSAYHLEYVEKPGKFDELVEQDGVRVLIEGRALMKVIGSEMDWVEDKLSARFTFNNPNITEQCGCGESFTV